MFSILTKHKICALMFFLSAFLLSAQSLAQLTPTASGPNHEKLYQVEVIVFGRPEANAQETWPTDIKLTYPENIVSLPDLDSGSDSGSSENLVAVPTNERTLNPQATTLARSGSYTLLFHQAWRQTIYASKTNIAISGGKVFNGHHELEGSITLSVGQYLKIQTNLWLTKFAPAGTNITESWPELPNLPNSFTNDVDASLGNAIQRIVKLNQERSMRSNEVHYIDHPVMGLIIKIIPVDTTTETTIN